MAFFLVPFLLVILVFLVSAIPLHIAVRILGGRTSIPWAAVTNFIAGVCGAIIYVSLSRYGAIVAFLALLVIYKFMFSLTWTRAFLAWILHGVIGFLLFLLLVSLGAMVI